MLLAKRPTAAPPPLSLDGIRPFTVALNPKAQLFIPTPRHPPPHTHIPCPSHTHGSLAGVDLNRVWNEPSRKLHPVIHATKAFLKQLGAEHYEVRGWEDAGPQPGCTCNHM